jgi:hypothetical protein
VTEGGGKLAFVCVDYDGGCDSAARVPIEDFLGRPAAAELAAPSGLNLFPGGGRVTTGGCRFGGGDHDDEDACRDAGGGSLQGGGELAGTREHTLPEARARSTPGRGARGGGTWEEASQRTSADCDGGCANTLCRKHVRAARPGRR